MSDHFCEHLKIRFLAHQFPLLYFFTNLLLKVLFCCSYVLSLGFSLSVFQVFLERKWGEGDGPEAKKRRSYNISSISKYDYGPTRARGPPYHLIEIWENAVPASTYRSQRRN